MISNKMGAFFEKWYIVFVRAWIDTGLLKKKLAKKWACIAWILLFGIFISLSYFRLKLT